MLNHHRQEAKVSHSDYHSFSAVEDMAAGLKDWPLELRIDILKGIKDNKRAKIALDMLRQVPIDLDNQLQEQFLRG